MFLLSLWCVLLFSIHAGIVNKQHHKTHSNVLWLFSLCVPFYPDNLVWQRIIARQLLKVDLFFFPNDKFYRETLVLLKIFTILMVKLCPRTDIVPLLCHQTLIFSSIGHYLCLWAPSLFFFNIYNQWSLFFPVVLFSEEAQSRHQTEASCGSSETTHWIPIRLGC